MMMKSMLLCGADAMGISMSDEQAEKFMCYHELLILGNERMNLTRISMDEPKEAVDRHYLDAIAPMAVAGLFSGVERLMDVGSGAGLPGIPLSIMLPGVHVVLLDSLKKRVDFLSEVILVLGLDAEAVHMRAEDAGRDDLYRERFDVVTARAVAGLSELLELTMPFARVGGRVLAYKGPSLGEERKAAAGAIAKLGGGGSVVHPVRIPERDWDHRILDVKKAGKTPVGYPRKPAEIAKKPL